VLAINPLEGTVPQRAQAGGLLWPRLAPSLQGRALTVEGGSSSRVPGRPPAASVPYQVSLGLLRSSASSLGICRRIGPNLFSASGRLVGSEQIQVCEIAPAASVDEAQLVTREDEAAALARNLKDSAIRRDVSAGRAIRSQWGKAAPGRSLPGRHPVRRERPEPARDSQQIGAIGVSLE
jgi:hypothetical protein